MLNDKQKSALWLGVCLVIAMGCYPPWKEIGPTGNPAAYAPIFAPPSAADGHTPVGIDFARLFLQWSMAGFLVGALLSTTAESVKPGRGSKDSARSEAHSEAAASGGKMPATANSGSANSAAANSGPAKSPAATPAAARSAATPAEATAKESEARPHPAGDRDGKRQEPTRVLKFPESANLGDVLAESTEDPDYWDFVAEARGTVEVPAGSRLQLEVQKELPIDLSTLAAINESAFHSIDLSHTQIEDADLAQLIGQTGLKELDLSDTAITDGAIEHIIKLPKLTKLWLDKTRITDKVLSELKTLPALTKLSLTGTEVTESEIRRLKSEFPQHCEIISASGNIA